jgi:hypothetical protein
MSKYESLGKYLESTDKDIVNLTFTKIEKILGFKLPNSLYEHPATWYGTAEGSPTHRWKVVWCNYGYKVEKIDLNAKYVIFRRINI